MHAYLLALLSFSGAALGQFIEIGSMPHDYRDRYHEIIFEYHDLRNVLLAKTTTECYFMRADSDTEQLLQTTATRYELEDRLYHQIHDHTGEHKTQLSALSVDLHDLRAAFECRGHEVYEITLLSTAAPDTTMDMFTTTTIMPDTTI